MGLLHGSEIARLIGSCWIGEARDTEVVSNGSIEDHKTHDRILLFMSRIKRIY